MPQTYVYSHGDLGEECGKLDELIFAKTIVEDLGISVDSPYVAAAGCDLSQSASGTLVELA